jgi:hypothetical protein
MGGFLVVEVDSIPAVGPLGLFGFERDVSYPHRILKLCMHCWGRNRGSPAPTACHIRPR